MVYNFNLKAKQWVRFSLFTWDNKVNNTQQGHQAPVTPVTEAFPLKRHTAIIDPGLCFNLCVPTGCLPERQIKTNPKQLSHLSPG